MIHHGYVRATRDIHVLVTADHGLDALLEGHGFVRVSPTRLRHRSDTPVDLLIAGTASPRADEAPYPPPESLTASERDPEVVGLVGLITLKLIARRAQDRADVVALLKYLPESEYPFIEAGVSAPKRRALWLLREEALEELAMERVGD